MLWHTPPRPPTPQAYSAAAEIMNKIYSASFPMTLNTWNMVPHLNIVEKWSDIMKKTYADLPVSQGTASNVSLNTKAEQCGGQSWPQNHSSPQVFVQRLACQNKESLAITGFQLLKGAAGLQSCRETLKKIIKAKQHQPDLASHSVEHYGNNLCWSLMVTCKGQACIWHRCCRIAVLPLGKTRKHGAAPLLKSALEIPCLLLPREVPPSATLLRRTGWPPRRRTDGAATTLTVSNWYENSYWGSSIVIKLIVLFSKLDRRWKAATTAKIRFLIWIEKSSY